MAEKVVGGLKWVKGEIAATLRRVRDLVERYSSSGDTAGLSDASDALVEVRGVLLALQLTLPAQLVEEMQRLAESMRERTVRDPKESAEAMMLALIQLPNHLDRLDAGADVSPLSLWPTINDLRGSRGAPPLSQAELLVPASVLSDDSEDELPLEDIEALGTVVHKVRPLFHRNLVEWFNPKTSTDGLVKLERLFHQIHRYLKDGSLADLFRLAEAYAGALQSGAVASGAEARSLVGHLDQVLKPLAQTPPVWPQDRILGLLEEFILALSQVQIASPLLAEIQGHYGQSEPPGLATGGAGEALASLSQTILIEFGTLKEQLDLFVRGERGDRTPLDDMSASLRNLARTLDVAAPGALPSRLRELADRFGGLAMTDAGDDVTRLEPLAAELLSIEARLQAYAEHRSPADDGLASEAFGADLSTATLREAEAELARVREAVQACHPQGARPGAFLELPRHLARISGALQILGEDPAAQLAQDIGASVQLRYVSVDLWPREGELVELANAIAALGLHLERLAEGVPAADDLIERGGEFLRALEAMTPDLGSGATGTGTRPSSTQWPTRETKAGAGLELESADWIRGVTSTPTSAPTQAEAREPGAEPGTEAPLAADHPSIFVADEELLDIFRSETEEHLDTVRTFLSRSKLGVTSVPDETTVRALHTITGSARMAGMESIADVAKPLELRLRNFKNLSQPLSQDVADLLEQALKAISLRIGELPAAGPGAQALANLAHTLANAPPPEEQAPPSVLLEPSEPSEFSGLEVTTDFDLSDLGLVSTDFGHDSYLGQIDSISLPLDEMPRDSELLEFLALPIGDEDHTATPQDSELIGLHSPKAGLELEPLAEPLAPAPAEDLEYAPDVGVDTYTLDVDRVFADLASDLAVDARPTEGEVLPASPAEEEPRSLFELQTAPEPEFKPTVEAQSEPEPVPELAPDIEPEPLYQAEPQLEAPTEAPPEPEPVPELAPDIEPEPLYQAEPQLEAPTEAPPEPEPVPELTPEIEPEPLYQAEPQIEAPTEAPPEPEPVPELAPEIEPEPLYQAEPQLEAPTEAPPEPEPVPELAPDIEPEPLYQAEPQIEAPTEAPPEPAVMPPVWEMPSVPAATPAWTLSTQGQPAGDFDAPPADTDLTSLFLEDARDLLDGIDAQIRAWQFSPQELGVLDGINRLLHTLKGSARLTGLTAIGDLSHALETRLTAVGTAKGLVDDTTLELTQRAADTLSIQVDALEQGAPIPRASALVAALNRAPVSDLDRVLGAPDLAVMRPTAAEVLPVSVEAPAAAFAALVADRESPQGGTPVPQIRVRSDLLNRLVDNAGEVGLYRARLSQRNGLLGFGLGELNQTVNRLREQLRLLEIETETQILHRFEREGPGSVEGSVFDPLEFDRFSMLQQLSRALAETVNDLVSLKDLLGSYQRESLDLLNQQARLADDLQDGLLRTRMVPFVQVVPRLHRLVRQTADNLGKSARLEIIGPEVELDRSILDRLVAPLEHLLRNAVDHGLETPDGRALAGKPAIGVVTLALSREGNDVVIELRDDGRGLNLEAIRAKALARGLLAPQAVLEDNALMQFVFEPGFTTVGRVTQISGRGVGLDVAASEIKAANGSIGLDSELGKGTRFTIRLPLTLAIVEAFVVTVGDNIYALPHTTVQGATRIAREDMEAIYRGQGRDLEYRGHQYRVAYLGGVLHPGQEPALGDRRWLPVLLTRVGDLRVALQVDNLIESSRILVKPLGPQLSGVRWLSGGTILPDGRVALILDALALLRSGAIQDYHPSGTFGAEMPATPLCVMVVDDSLTVRRVTARLLRRQNIEVLTAKDGVEALTLLDERRPDLMLLDIEMPRMDGYELTRHIRRSDRFRDLPIIMITSRTGEKHRDHALALGVNRYLGKPYQETDLLNEIASVLSEVNR